MASKGSVILTVAIAICLLCSPFLTGFNVLLVQFPATVFVIFFGLIVWLAGVGADFNFFKRILSVCLVIILISTVYVYSVGHFIGDLAKFIMASVVCWVGLSRDDFYIKKPLFLACAAFCAATVFSSIGVRFYSITEQGDSRFSGLLGNINLNSYVFLLCCIYISLIIMRHRGGFGKATLILGYVFIQFLSGTKSLIFALPFIAAVCFNINLKISRIFLLFGALIFVLTLGVVWQYLGDVFLVDPSLGTRWVLTGLLLDEVFSSYLRPLGIGYSRLLLEGVGDINSAHNDFLQYTLDLGFAFWIMLIFACRRLFVGNMQSLFFAIFCFTAAFHNNLISVYVLPLVVICASYLRLRGIDKIIPD